MQYLFIDTQIYKYILVIKMFFLQHSEKFVFYFHNLSVLFCDFFQVSPEIGWN